MRFRTNTVLTAGLLALIGVSGLTACDTYVGDPWVSGPEQLQEERARSPEQAEALRDRLTRIQNAR